MVSKSAWKIGLSLALLTALAAPAVAQTRCPTRCPVVEYNFSELQRDLVITDLATGLPTDEFPSYVWAAGRFQYELPVTAAIVADVKKALAANCPVNVRFMTGGLVFVYNDATSRFWGIIQTIWDKGSIEQVLGTAYPTQSAPASPNGTYYFHHSAPILAPLSTGTALVVEGEGFAEGRALGNGGGDQASGMFEMIAQDVTGAPQLEVCTPP